MGYKCISIAAVMISGLLLGSCSSDDIKDKIAGEADPVPGATGNLVVTTVPEFVLALINALLPAPGGAGKPSAAGITVLSALEDKKCGESLDVNVVFTPPNPDTTFTAMITDCVDENVVINGDVVGGTIGGLDPTCDLPTSISGEFTGTVDVEGEVFTFTDFGVAVTAIDYGTGCDLDGNASFIATLTGDVSSDLFSIDFGTGSLVLNVKDIDDKDGISGNGEARQLIIEMTGDITVETPCESGSLTIATIQDLVTDQPDVCPFAGMADYSGAFGNATVDFAVEGCDIAACVF